MAEDQVSIELVEKLGKDDIIQFLHCIEPLSCAFILFSSPQTEKLRGYPLFEGQTYNFAILAV